MKCGLCGKSIGTTFLGKIIGTYVKNKDGKRVAVCFECQKKFKTREGILSSI